MCDLPCLQIAARIGEFQQHCEAQAILDLQRITVSNEYIRRIRGLYKMLKQHDTVIKRHGVAEKEYRQKRKVADMITGKHTKVTFSQPPYCSRASCMPGVVVMVILQFICCYKERKLSPPGSSIPLPSFPSSSFLSAITVANNLQPLRSNSYLSRLTALYCS